MAKVVDPDFFHAGFFTACVKVIQDGVLRRGKEPVLAAKSVDGVHVVLDDGAEKGRDSDGPDTLRRFGLLNQILAVQTGIALGDADCLLFQVEICCGQR